MSAYRGLGLITDQSIKDVLKTAFDEIAALRKQVTALQAATLQRGATIDAENGRLIHVGDARAEGDAVNLRQLRAYVDAVKKASYG